MQTSGFTYRTRGELSLWTRHFKYLNALATQTCVVSDDGKPDMSAKHPRCCESSSSLLQSSLSLVQGNLVHGSPNKTRQLGKFLLQLITSGLLYSWIGNHGDRKLASAGCNVPHSPQEQRLSSKRTSTMTCWLLDSKIFQHCWKITGPKSGQGYVKTLLTSMTRKQTQDSWLGVTVGYSKI